MVVVLIVGILAAVAMPLMTSRINQAKWSEARAAAGTIATAIRAYAADQRESGDYTALLGPITDGGNGALLGIAQTDVKGTYFDSTKYDITSCSYSTANGVSFTIVVAPSNSMAPGTPSKVLTVVNNQTITTAADSLL